MSTKIRTTMNKKNGSPSLSFHRADPFHLVLALQKMCRRAGKHDWCNNFFLYSLRVSSATILLLGTSYTGMRLVYDTRKYKSCSLSLRLNQRKTTMLSTIKHNTSISPSLCSCCLQDNTSCGNTGVYLCDAEK